MKPQTTTELGSGSKMTLPLQTRFGLIIAMAFLGGFLSCDDGKLNTAANALSIKGNAKFCQEACKTDTDCKSYDDYNDYICVDNRCLAEGCNQKDTDECKCSCKKEQTCMNNGNCTSNCKTDDDCEKIGFYGDVCYDGVCGCSDVSACKKIIYEGATIVCEGL